MATHLRPALVLLALFTLLTGAVYPAAVTGLAQLFWPAQAEGSLLTVDGRSRGSALIGQSFSQPQYFWGRPSATASTPFNAGASGGSNLGPSNPTLHARVAQRLASLRAAHPTEASAVPVDLVTTSGSGLDPHISLAAALYQARRVAEVRGVEVALVQRLVQDHTEGRVLGLLGEPRVNVLRLNLALDATAGAAAPQP